MIKFLLLSIILVSKLAIGQVDYATINIYKSNALYASIYINDVFVAKLKHGHLEYKVFNIQNCKITISNDKSYRSEIQVNLTRGGNYSFDVKTKYPVYLGYYLQPINQLSNSNKIKNGEFISLSDAGNLNNSISEPDTQWNYSKLINHWTQNGISDIEGIYERIALQIEYKLAVVKENNEYKIIYLAGARGTNWQEGDIKAVLQKTAQFGIFKSGWYMIDKSSNNDVIITFENSSMKTISENGQDQDLYLKIYPTYDEANIIPGSDWKSTGSGFFVDKKGYIVTNYHVVENGKIVEVNFTTNGKKESYQVDIISVDRQNDLAILKINNTDFNPLTELKYNFNTSIMDVGSSVFALGYPLTQIMGDEIKFTDGKISSKSGYKGDITTYQISVPIQPGNSGGPLFDEQGNLVGITSSGINKQLADNANYAIKTDYLKLLINSSDIKIELPNNIELRNKSLPDKIKILSEYVVLIKVK